jgi:hypothetical protein
MECILTRDLRDASFLAILLLAVLQKGQKCVQLDMALGMWHLLFSEDRSWQYLEDWVDFLQTHHAHRAISKDTWVQLFEFVKVGERVLAGGRPIFQET